MSFKILDDFTPFSKMPEEIIEKYNGKIPDQFIEIWK